MVFEVSQMWGLAGQNHPVGGKVSGRLNGIAVVDMASSLSVEIYALNIVESNSKTGLDALHGGEVTRADVVAFL